MTIKKNSWSSIGNLRLHMVWFNGEVQKRWKREFVCQIAFILSKILFKFVPFQTVQ